MSERYIETEINCRCGGKVRIQDYHKPGEFRYEAFCVKCGTCDPNGWSSRKKAMENAVVYFGKREADAKARGE
jgi:hypothetical protein